jgi:hypothetical protein
MGLAKKSTEMEMIGSWAFVTDCLFDMVIYVGKKGVIEILIVVNRL